MHGANGDPKQQVECALKTLAPDSDYYQAHAEKVDATL